MPSGFEIKTKATGLHNNDNEFVVPEGSLSVADNVFINRDNVIERRPGFDNCSTGLPLGNKPLQLFSFDGQLYVHIDENIYVTNGDCNYTRVSGIGPVLSTINSVFYDGVSALYMGLDAKCVVKYDFNTYFMSIFAGLPGVAGSTDGIGAAARFGDVGGICGDGTNLYVCDITNFTIRKIVQATAAVTTFAGTAGAPGSADGVGAIARFNIPKALWCDATNIFVSDSLNNQTIRQIDIATATVSTLAGTAGVTGSADGVGPAASFNQPAGIWGDGTNLYVCDLTNRTIRKIVIGTATVSTFAGTAGAAGSTNGIGAAARFRVPVGLWGNTTDLYVSDVSNFTIRKIVQATAAVTTFAGTTGTSGFVDGVGPASQFSAMQLIWANNSTIYVADNEATFNTKHAVRGIDIPTQNVRTLIYSSGNPTIPVPGYLLTNVVGPY